MPNALLFFLSRIALLLLGAVCELTREIVTPEIAADGEMRSSFLSLGTGVGVCCRQEASVFSRRHADALVLFPPVDSLGIHFSAQKGPPRQRLQSLPSD